MSVRTKPAFLIHLNPGNYYDKYKSITDSISSDF